MILSKHFKQLFITESQQDFGKTIALVGGSFKFPTIAHWYMVEQYTKKADEVVILISDPKSPKSIRKTSTGTIITAQMAKDIFDIYINKYGFQNKVKAIISPEPSPITALFKYIDNNLSDVNVIMGVSKKGGDESRFKSAEKYYADNEHIHLLDPLKTAVEPYLDKNGQPISATDARNNLENIEIIKNYLPEKLSDSDVLKVLAILEVKPMTEATEMSKMNLDPVDETEEINVIINDDVLLKSKLMAYNIGLLMTDTDGKPVPVNPKKFPEKAIDIIIPYDSTQIEIFLDTELKQWKSEINYNGRICHLSPDQFGDFFNSRCYAKLMRKLQKEWPLSDDFYNNLYTAVANKEMYIGDVLPVIEDTEEPERKKYSATGRKIMNFGDIGVKSSSAVYTCWPTKDKEFRWSQWKDWRKIKPLCRMRFEYTNGHEYGITISAIGDNYENRGFRSYDLTEQPPLQWLSKAENADLMKLSAFNKFIRHCINRIQEYVNMDPNEVFEKINNPEKITVEDIVKTQTVIRKTLNNIIKKKQIDDFKWNK